MLLYYVKPLSAAAVWERFSISSTRVEPHLQEKTSSFSITYYLSLQLSHTQVPDKEFKLAKGNTQVIKPAAHVQTQLYTCANCDQVRTNQDAVTIERTCRGAQIKGNANMNDWCSLCYLRTRHQTVAFNHRFLCVGDVKADVTGSTLETRTGRADEAEMLQLKIFNVLCSAKGCLESFIIDI